MHPDYAVPGNYVAVAGFDDRIEKALVELFGVKVPAVAKHLKNIFDSGELGRAATVSKMEIVVESPFERV